MRDFAAAHQEMRRLRKQMDQSFLPDWENALADAITRASGPDGVAASEVAKLKTATKALLDQVDASEQAAGTLDDAKKKVKSKLEADHSESQE